uniref:Uncharacterized protein n=1 Tax=Globodera rostochiensis TaxID=31243 RepID=A0A914H5B0_GLORO
MVHLIVRHTPKSMRMYSKILLQTCATDFALLTNTLLFHQYMFTTDKGESEVIAGGLITFNGTQNRGLNLLAWRLRHANSVHAEAAQIRPVKVPAAASDSFSRGSKCLFV